MSLSVLSVLSILLVLSFLVFLLYKKISNQSDKPDQSQSLLLLQSQLNEVTRTLDARLQGLDIKLQHQFTSSETITKDLVEKLTRLGETNKQVVNFADQLRSLQDILKNPKQRGILGEYSLEMLLRNVFQPKQYQMQYHFSDGEIVDAVIFLGEKVIPIDSKFSLENYHRLVEEKEPARQEQLEKLFRQDLKNRIDEAAKYIRPQDGTTDFAFMFIPAEGIYYDLLVNRVGALKVSSRDLIDYAVVDKKVHIVSPTTFYVALQSMWESMRSYQIQESTKQILKNVEQLQRHIKAYDDYFQKVGGHLGTTVGAYNAASKELGKIDKDILRIGGEAVGVEVMRLEKPET